MALSTRPRVLVLRALGLGDLLTAVPALRGLRRAFPGTRLVLAAPRVLGEWLRCLGIVDEALPHDGLRPLRWPGPPPELAVNLHGRGPQSHRVLAAVGPRRTVAHACPEAGFRSGPRWRDHVHEVDRWCSLVRGVGGGCGPEDLRLPTTGARSERPYAVVHPGAGAAARRWPAERWSAVASALLADGHDVVLTGSRTETGLCAVVAAGAHGVTDRSGSLDVPALARTVDAASLVVSGDTGPAHLATAYGTPSVTLFGPTDPAEWGPRVDRSVHHVLWHPMPAAPAGDPHGAHPDPRLLAITAEQVLEGVAAVLRESGRVGALLDEPRHRVL